MEQTLLQYEFGNIQSTSASDCLYHCCAGDTPGASAISNGMQLIVPSHILACINVSTVERHPVEGCLKHLQADAVHHTHIMSHFVA